MKISHLGHACLLVETSTARILIDPGTLSTFEQVRDLDAVLVTHQHPDHADVARIGRLLEMNPRAQLVIDADTTDTVVGFPAAIVARPGDHLRFGRSGVDVLGGIHAAVYGDLPGCANCTYLVDDGALLHPGDSFFVPEQDVDVLAVAIDAPWLKLAEAVGYVHAVSPRIAVPVREGETTDAAKYIGMLDRFSPPGVVKRLEPGALTDL